MGNWIKLTASDKHQFDGYVAAPSGKPRGGLVVIQEIFGVNRHMRALTDRLAAEGYAALAPALFDRVERNVDVGYDEAGVTKGRAVRQRLGYEEAMRDTAAAVAHLQQFGKVGIVGYCWGGNVVWLAACRLPVAAAVGYYGGDIASLLNETPKAPLQLHFGELDQHITPAAVARIRAAVPKVPVHTYPAGHGFNCDERKDYDAASADLARERTLAFFAEHVG
ncbi:MAG TPA: dienelactone hydrolase family protein [Candidatus Angelobacter sp.]|nr:dienelactone hydrolase family protein [Candidatus Angelobacter sp.]